MSLRARSSPADDCHRTYSLPALLTLLAVLIGCGGNNNLAKPQALIAPASAAAPAGSTPAPSSGATSTPSPTIQFSANPASISAGQNSVLSWNTTNATSVSIQPESLNLGGSGSVTVTPSVTTTYTLTATGAGGTVTATTTVTVTPAPPPPTPAPTIQFSANPASITAGQSSLLSWTTTDATAVSIQPGSSNLTVSGSMTVTPAATTTYTATASGAGGTTTATATVTVTAAPPPPTSGPPPSGAGPQTAWMVITLPNPAVTPNWQTYAPADCLPDPSVCAEDDHRFWEEWDFSTFSQAIDASFGAIATQGQYYGVMLLMPLADSPTFWNNIQLMYNSAASHNLAFQAVVFPKYKFGDESCYLYNANAPGMCPTAAGTTTAIAYQQMLKMMNFVENLGTGCSNQSSSRPFSIWYGWSSMPGYQVLSSFWESLPTAPCNLRASYITWLDTDFTTAPEVGQLQAYVTKTLGQPYWVNTELYSTAQIQQGAALYLPYQTVINGYWGATTTAAWAQGMCANWTTAGKPAQFAVWTFSDRDLVPIESYGAYINGSLAAANNICSQ